MHARSGGNIEVMGLMQGKIQDDTMIVLDSFALPVEGTETRVNAAAEGYEYMVDYMTKSNEVGRSIAKRCLELRADSCFPCEIAGRTHGERSWVVPQSPGLRLLAFWD